MQVNGQPITLSDLESPLQFYGQDKLYWYMLQDTTLNFMAPAQLNGYQ